MAPILIILLYVYSKKPQFNTVSLITWFVYYNEVDLYIKIVAKLPVQLASFVALEL